MIEPTDLNLRHLDAARVALRLGSITAAAATVNLSQPSVTQALSKLERQVGHRLFEREPGGVRPTPAGAMFADRINRGIEQFVEACRTVRKAAHLPAPSFPERHVSMTQLRSFDAVERNGSFMVAARVLGVSQPSVHRATRELELFMRVRLLVHVGRTMQPTTAGGRLARGSRLALAELRAGLDELNAIKGAGGGRIRIGTLPLPRAGLLPRALADFAVSHPRAEVSIEEAPYPELLVRLRSGEIDVLLGALRPDDPASGIEQRMLFEDDLFVVAGAGHPLAGTDPDTAALARYPWIAGPPGAPMRATWNEMFESDPPSQRIECASAQVARGLLLQGEWLALMSPDQFRIEQKVGLLIPIGGAVPGSRRRIGLAVRMDWKPTATQQALVDALYRAAEIYD